MSSSGHVALLERLGQKIIESHAADCAMTRFFLDENDGIKKLVSDLLHGPFILILPLFFYSQLLPMFSLRARFAVYIKKIIFFVITGDFITGCSYFLVRLTGVDWFPIYLGFFISGLLLYSLRFVKNRGGQGLTLDRSIILGLVQSIALLPGISRFGSTFVVGRWLGFSSRRSFQISFLFEWPLLCAAFLKALIKIKLFGNGWHEFLSWHMIVVIGLSSVGAFVLLKCIKRLVDQNLLWMFSIYLFAAAFGCYFYDR